MKNQLSQSYEIDYQIVKDGLPELPVCHFQYLWARDGFYVRAERENLRALIYHTATMPTHGLGWVKPMVQIPSRVPVDLVKQMLDYARDCAPNGSLFYLVYEERKDFKPWQLVIPNQMEDPGWSRAVDPDSGNARQAVIEIMSIGEGAANFTKRHDETNQDFKIYAVIGRANSQPEIAVRIGIYGHFMGLAAKNVFELPIGVIDVREFNLGIKEA